MMILFELSVEGEKIFVCFLKECFDRQVISRGFKPCEVSRFDYLCHNLYFEGVMGSKDMQYSDLRIPLFLWRSPVIKK